jgi:short-subunit dehydrogenase
MKARQGVVTLVTGASAGIGSDIARRAAKDSRRIVLTARRRDRLEALATELANGNPGLETVVCPGDLADRGFRDRLLAGPGAEVDHLVSNAGFGDAGDLEDFEPGRHLQMVDVNVAALVHLTSALYRHMAERGYGRILHVASTASFQPVPRLAVYAATKAFVRSFSEALWREGRRKGVGVTCLCPGVTDTEFFEAGAGFRKKHRGMSSDTVARIGYRAMLRGKRTVVAGFLNRTQTLLIPFIPKRLILWVGEKIM